MLLKASTSFSIQCDTLSDDLVKLRVFFELSPENLEGSFKMVSKRVLSCNKSARL